MRHEPKNRFASARSNKLVRTVISVPPRYNHLPLSAKSADKLNEVKITAVPSNAVIIMLGLISITVARSGPIPKPEKIDINTVTNQYILATILSSETKRMLSFGE
jgi:hypothetical protein